MRSITPARSDGARARHRDVKELELVLEHGGESANHEGVLVEIGGARDGVQKLDLGAVLLPGDSLHGNHACERAGVMMHVRVLEEPCM
jgi:hypothetical protein